MVYKKGHKPKFFCVSKKSTIFLQSLWNLIKTTTSCVGNFAWISAKLDKICGFFINGEVLSLCPFLCITLYSFNITNYTMKFYDSRHTNLHARHKWTSMCHFESCFHKEASQGGQFWARILSSFHSPVMQQIFQVLNYFFKESSLRSFDFIMFQINTLGFSWLLFVPQGSV